MHNKKAKKEFGNGARKCIRCGTLNGVIRRHNLMICRRCMREVAKKIGFKKYG